MRSLPLKVSNLRKEYAGSVAVESLSFEVGEGQIVGLLGPNGAGKTTSISMILGVLAPTSGSIEIDGVDLSRERSRALQRTNFAAIYSPLPGNLSVIENLNVAALLYSVKDRKRRIDELIERFDLATFRKTKCGQLSSGEQTRVGLAKAMLNRPRLLLLDEPTSSLDPATAAEVRQHIRDFVAEERGGVLWTSHNMYEVEGVCDYAMILAQGMIVLQGNPRDLPAQHGKETMEELFIAVARPQ